MKTIVTKSAFIVFLFCLFSSCKKEEIIEGPCDNLEGRIHQDLRNMFPYSSNLKGIIFENDQEVEFVFEVIEKGDAIEVVNANSGYPYEAERVEFELFNSELNLYFTITLYSGYATFLCPEEATLNGFVSVKGPLHAGVPSSAQSQSYNLIVVQVVDSGIEIESSDFPSFIWVGHSYQDVYAGKGEFDIFFNFETGIVGFKDPNTSMRYGYKKTLTE